MVASSGLISFELRKEAPLPSMILGKQRFWSTFRAKTQLCWHIRAVVLPGLCYVVQKQRKGWNCDEKIATSVHQLVDATNPIDTPRLFSLLVRQILSLPGGNTRIHGNKLVHWWSTAKGRRYNPFFGCDANANCGFGLGKSLLKGLNYAMWEIRYICDYQMSGSE